MEGLEHVACKVGGVCARRKTKGNIADLARMYDGGYSRIEGKRFSPSTSEKQVNAVGVEIQRRRSGSDLLINSTRIVVLGLDRGAHMRIDPEGP